MMSKAETLLRRLAEGDESSLRLVLAPGLSRCDPLADQGLDKRTAVLVRLGALMAVDAPTASLRWAVELATCTGADDDAIVGVLLSSGRAGGAAQLVASAPRLALALGFEMELEGWDGS